MIPVHRQGSSAARITNKSLRFKSSQLSDVFSLHLAGTSLRPCQKLFLVSPRKAISSLSQFIFLLSTRNCYYFAIKSSSLIDLLAVNGSGWCRSQGVCCNWILFLPASVSFFVAAQTRSCACNIVTVVSQKRLSSEDNWNFRFLLVTVERIRGKEEFLSPSIIASNFAPFNGSSRVIKCVIAMRAVLEGRKVSHALETRLLCCHLYLWVKSFLRGQLFVFLAASIGICIRNYITKNQKAMANTWGPCQSEGIASRVANCVSHLADIVPHPAQQASVALGPAMTLMEKLHISVIHDFATETANSFRFTRKQKRFETATMDASLGAVGRAKAAWTAEKGEQKIARKKQRKRNFCRVSNLWLLFFHCFHLSCIWFCCFLHFLFVPTSCSNPKNIKHIN